MDLYRYASNDRRGAFHYVREVAGGMLVALCGRQTDAMRPLAAATAKHTECRRCAAARAELVEPAAVEDAEEQPAAVAAVAEQDAPALYRPVHSRRGAGHYRRPGTASSYCGRTVEAAPVGPQSVTGICQLCAKSEARERVEAEQVAADRAIDGPTLAERAGVRYALVGTGRRVHYSNNDDTLCGREVTSYTDGLDDRRDSLCARCITAAEQRAYARALAAASPLAAAAVDLAETIEQADAEREQAAPTAHEPAKVPGALVDPWTWIRGTWPDAEQRAEQPVAEESEAMLAAQLVTEADATDGTWRGEWIGEQPADDALFALEPTVEQGALFTPGARVVCADGRERTVERVVERRGEPSRVVVEDGAEWIADNCRPATAPAPTVGEQRRAALARIKAKADADRAAHRATTDDAIAAECAAHGVPAPRTVAARIAARAEQEPARRVVEGVVVEHNGTATGSTPANATHPNVIAARAALDNLAAAALTDHHDVTDPTDAELDVRGYMVDPREGARVAVYWLEAGRIIRRDDPAHGPALDCLADRLERRGWTVEPMLRSSQCVFAHRPQ